jgi:hypothetical protein
LLDLYTVFEFKRWEYGCWTSFILRYTCEKKVFVGKRITMLIASTRLKMRAFPDLAFERFNMIKAKRADRIC